MAVSATITPGAVVTENDNITVSLLNQIANPTVDLSGAVDSLALGANAVTDTNVASGAAIQFSKMESTLSGRIIVGNASNAATVTQLAGDATLAFNSSTSNADLTIADDAGTTAKVLDGAITAAKLDSAVSTPPTGSISGFIKSAAAPSGWAYCDGSHYDSTASDYTALFALIQYQYGRTDSSGGDDETGTYFKVPNLKGRIPVGYDSNQSEFNLMGETGGAKSHTLTISEMPSHTHAINMGARAGSNSGSNAGRTPDTSGSDANTQSAGSGTAFNILNPYVVVEYIIKL